MIPAQDIVADCRRHLSPCYFPNLETLALRDIIGACCQVEGGGSASDALAPEYL